MCELGYEMVRLCDVLLSNDMLRITMKYDGSSMEFGRNPFISYVNLNKFLAMLSLIYLSNFHLIVLLLIMFIKTNSIPISVKKVKFTSLQRSDICV